MYTDEAAAKNKNNKRDIIANAYAKFATLTQAEVVDALYMFGKDADYTDMEICKNTLGELLEKDPENGAARAVQGLQAAKRGGVSHPQQGGTMSKAGSGVPPPAR